PDVLTVAKGLANGLPIGATLAKDAVADLFQPGDHGSTFSGGPVVCRAALAVLKTLSPDRLRRIARTSRIFEEELERWGRELSPIRAVRGVGFMWGIELDRPGAAVVDLCRKDGLLVNCTAEKVIRLLPPYCLTEKEIRRGLSVLKRNLELFFQKTSQGRIENP
ncbi:MAG: aminotransferase class III-fold pyridoxal phosphate-dependent enzyme, partial [Elusimicrobia bacterium]|nr:aminotransferase class III-fold pyridoxal phosphate-dependent enzyme [Elusimicrobiota bacterium]